MRASLRLQLTVLATLVVLVVLGLGAAVLFALQRAQFVESVDRSLTQRADTIGELLVLDDLPDSFTADDDDRAVQIVGPEGAVVESSENLNGEGPIADLSATAEETIRTLDILPIGEDAFRVLSRRVESGSGSVVLHVAESTDDLEDSSEALLTSLAATLPVIVALFAGLTWWLVGRTLRPVDSLRAEVDSITDSSELRQVSPPTRDDEIGKLTSTLNQMLERLHRSDEQQRRFVADAAHELRTPLTRIRTTVEVDLAQPGDAAPSRTNAEVRREAIDLQALIDDLLHLSTSDDGGATIVHHPVDLDDIVMTEIRNQRLDNSQVAIDASGVSDGDVVGDEHQLRRAVRNLLNNASRHAHATVAVHLSQVADLAILHVDDDGSGVPEDQRETVFDRFTRLDEARSSEVGGTGLGLAITRDIVSRHSGTVTCTDSPLGGARFTVSLPTRL